MKGIVVLHQLFRAGAGVTQEQLGLYEFLSCAVMTPVNTVCLVSHLISYSPSKVEEMVAICPWKQKRIILESHGRIEG